MNLHPLILRLTTSNRFQQGHRAPQVDPLADHHPDLLAEVKEKADHLAESPVLAEAQEDKAAQADRAVQADRAAQVDRAALADKAVPAEAQGSMAGDELFIYNESKISLMNY